MIKFTNLPVKFTILTMDALKYGLSFTWGRGVFDTRITLTPMSKAPTFLFDTRTKGPRFFLYDTQGIYEEHLQDTS